MEGWSSSGTITPSHEYVTGTTSAGFASNVTSGSTPLSVKLTDTSTGDAPVIYSYRLTNVTPGNNTELASFSSSASPELVLPIGNWTINQTVLSMYSSSSSYAWVNVSSSGVQIPIVRWITDKTTVLFPGRIAINSTSLNTPEAWNYSLGDGQWRNFTSAESANFSYQYLKRGRWVANLTVSNSAGTNTSASKSKSITVIGYQGFELPLKQPSAGDICEYSTSRPLDILERRMTDCKICGICN